MADESERHGQTVSPRISRRAIWAGALGVTAAGLAGLGAWLSRTPVGLLDGHSRSRAIDGDSVLPQSVDVLIIGGGFVGAFAALALAERGVSVALCEKGAIAGEASG
ncbi:MAG TPA: FAD-dependent oxidoreductase, partial [Steroidobacteraceae bacterium]|nr:FAD-dependent oxidoreductase [Steroidobacteraceae bacterium]